MFSEDHSQEPRLVTPVDEIFIGRSPDTGQQCVTVGLVEHKLGELQAGDNIK